MQQHFESQMRKLSEMADDMRGAPTPEQIFRLEDAIRGSGLPMVDIDVVHYHAKGLYGRQILIPAGTICTGKMHKDHTLNVCVGDIEVLTSKGMKRLRGWNVFVTEPGIKKCAFTYADTVFLNVHATDKTDVGDIEREVTYDQFDAHDLIEKNGGVS